MLELQLTASSLSFAYRRECTHGDSGVSQTSDAVVLQAAANDLEEKLHRQGRQHLGLQHLNPTDTLNQRVNL